MINLKGKSAILYRRVSTTDQKQFGNSLNAQQGSLRDFCEKNSMNIVKEFQEDYSAKNFNRPEWKRLNAFAKKNKKDIDYLIILSGPEPQRSLLEKKLTELKAPNSIKIVLVRGTEQPFSHKTELETHNLVQQKELESLIQRSKKLICRSGYTTIMDLHFLQIPSILIPTPGQTEQEYLAEQLIDESNYLVRPQNQLTSEIFDWEPKADHKKSLPNPDSYRDLKAFENALLFEGFVMPTT